MRGISKILLAAGLVLFGFAVITAFQTFEQNTDTASASGLNQTEPTEEPWMDHSVFPQLAGPFETASDVTSACLSCHQVSAQQVMETIHWTWQYEDPITGELVGKYNIINNYCINPQSNEPRCTSCHVGYGWEDNTFDFTAEENVDCLVCHDRSGDYAKFPTAAGHPAYEDTQWQGELWPAVDLAAVAQQVGPPTNENCGSCHFYSGGGDAVKHGDLDSSLIEPERSLDVHMSPEGAGFTCTDCHTAEQHEIAGTLYSSELSERLSCSSCHTEEPHDDAMLNMHTGTLSCQVCHIPEYARGRTTKMTWDWSEAGDLNEEGQPFTTQDENGDVIYDSQKGAFTWARDVIPTYIWWNGTVDYQIVGEEIDPDGEVLINQVMGSREDENARIFPYKVFEAIQPYDPANNLLAVPALFPGGAGGSNAYWASWDWNRAIQAGMDYAGLDYSGEFDFIETKMNWLVTHQVAPAEDSLGCTDCHSPEGRLDFTALGFSEDDAAMLASFPPAPPAQATAVETEAPAETPEEPAETAGPLATPQPTFEPRPTFAPPEDALGEPDLEVGSGLTPLAWFLVILGGLIFAGLLIYIFFRFIKR